MLNMHSYQHIMDRHDVNVYNNDLNVHIDALNIRIQVSIMNNRVFNIGI
jgi:glutathionyl-hydroquinone reductase